MKKQIVILNVDFIADIGRENIVEKKHFEKKMEETESELSWIFKKIYKQHLLVSYLTQCKKEEWTGGKG